MSGGDHIAEPTADQPDRFVGMMIADKYEVRHLIARGGMGRVYEAIQHPLGRRVAVKILQPRHAQDGVIEDFKKRFLREAAAYARLAHSNTVTMFDYGAIDDDKGTLFMVMEFVRGQTLKDLIQTHGVLDADHALRIAYQVVLSLREAHRMGIVHRDLKPSNIMVDLHQSRPDSVKVLDFGLAKILDPETSGSISFAEEFQQVVGDGQSLSKHGVVIGSPGYMAPEQIEGEAVDKRTDIYSLGIILFEMLTGEKPFRGLNSIATLMLHLNAEIPTFYDVNPDVIVPDDIESLVRKCLEKQPDARFINADALLAAIRDATPPGGLGDLYAEEMPRIAATTATEETPVAPASTLPAVLPYVLAAVAAVALVGAVLLLT